MTTPGPTSRSARRCGWRLVILMPALLVLTGCVTAKKYRLAKPNTPPAKFLNWQAETPPVELTLQTVIRRLEDGMRRAGLEPPESKGHDYGT